MFDGFVVLNGTYRTIVIVSVDGTALEPDQAPTFRLYGPDGEMEVFRDQPLQEIDEVAGVHSWTPDIVCSAGNGFVAGATYHMVVRAVKDPDILTGGDLIRSFTVT